MSSPVDNVFSQRNPGQFLLLHPLKNSLKKPGLLCVIVQLTLNWACSSLYRLCKFAISLARIVTDWPKLSIFFP